MDAGIAKTTQSLTSAAEMQDTTNAPLSIAIMGELVFISSGTDFSINKNPPPTGFKYIKYPDSFRACLMQICHSGWDAFNEAHNNMDQICSNMAIVPDYIKTAVEFISKGSDEIIKTLVPNQLESICTIVKECMELANNVNNTFQYVINLIHELLQTCTGAEGFYIKDQEEVKKKLKENEMRKKTVNEQNERFNKEMENLSKQMEDAQDEETKAMQNLPTGWKWVALNCADAIIWVMVGMVGMANSFTGLLRWPFASQGAAENARFRIEQGREQLKQRREWYEKCEENIEKNKKELTDVLDEMNNCKSKEIDLETKIKKLMQCLDAMGKVKEQWVKMVHFFQRVFKIMKHSVRKTQDLSKIADCTMKLSVSNKLFATHLCKEAFEASNVASLVHMIAETYTEVSNKYLMDGMSSLEKLMCMDRSKPDFLQEYQKLQKSCQAAQDGILQLVRKNKEEFERKTKKERERDDNY